MCTPIEGSSGRRAGVAEGSDERRAPGALLAAAAAIGLAASASLYVSTLRSAVASGATGAGVMAMAQAIGVCIGAFAVPAWLSLPAGRLARFTGLIALGASLALTLGALPIVVCAVLVGLVGVAVGVWMSTLESLAARDARAGREASGLVMIAAFAATGATLAPLICEAAAMVGAAPNLVTATGLGVALVCGLPILKSGGLQAGRAGLRLAGWPPLYVLATPFAFGLVDNGVLALAPAHFALEGLRGWALPLVGVAAHAGVMILQVSAVLWTERRGGGSAGVFLFAGLGLATAALLYLRSATDPTASAAAIVLLGAALEIAYGAQLLRAFRGVRSRVAVAVAFTFACAAGEMLGPLLTAGLSGREASGWFFLAPALILAATGVVSLWPMAARIAGAAAGRPRLRVRAARWSDLAAALRIERRAFETDRVGAREFRQLKRDGRVELLVAERADDVVGVAILKVAPGAGYLYSLAVDPAARRQGVGRRLLAAAIAAARRRGCRRIDLEARPSNAGALSLYRAAGFVEAGWRDGWYEDGGPARLMSLQIAAPEKQRPALAAAASPAST